eukprot:349747-Chlamydomonas_euryale.AAC.1
MAQSARCTVRTCSAINKGCRGQRHMHRQHSSSARRPSDLYSRFCLVHAQNQMRTDCAWNVSLNWSGQENRVSDEDARWAVTGVVIGGEGSIPALRALADVLDLHAVADLKGEHDLRRGAWHNQVGELHDRTGRLPVDGRRPPAANHRLPERAAELGRDGGRDQVNLELVERQRACNAGQLEQPQGHKLGRANSREAARLCPPGGGQRAA